MTDIHDRIRILAHSLLDAGHDAYSSPGDAGEDAGIRAAMRAIIDALAEDIGDHTAAVGAVVQAIMEISGTVAPAM